MAFLRHFALKVESHMTDDTFAKLPFAFPEAQISSFKLTKARAEFLAAFRPVPYDCCINSCCCYAGPHAAVTTCPHCQEPRFNAKGGPRKRFNYVPLIPRLTAYYRNKSFVELLSYRAKFSHEPSKIKDVMDSKNYARLREEYVTVDQKRQPYKFFDDPRDIALGMSTDGFAPFRRRKKTCWPLLLFNYNLPPEIRFHLQYILCIGVIPGPNKPKDFDSFFWPAVEELLKLAMGVRAFDTARSELFALRAYLIIVFGDIPAVSMVMRIKGHNGVRPCRMCNIQGLRVPNSRATTHYVPLDRSRHPDVRRDDTAIKKYNPSHLPLRSHAEFLEQGRQVQFASNRTNFEDLSKQFGVKGTPILTSLSSIHFPSSFPYDFMHLIFENVMKNLVLLWTGKFKGLDEGNGSYEFCPKVWEAIGAATASSGSSIPLAFGARPPNVADDRSATTADTWSFWMLYLGPVLLSRRFRNQVYFNHFIDLVKLIQICLQFEITMDEVSTLRVGFERWVEKYEQ
jgi:Transposase family tnp2.